MELYTPAMKQLACEIETALPLSMPSADTPYHTVASAMAYACEAGGKRLRPLLVLQFARMGGTAVDAAMPYALALEMIHCYSLVHDDLPCMDNSTLRRGRPSTFAKFGEDMALLAGDGLLTRAFEWGLLPRHTAAVGTDAALLAMSLLAEAAGIDGMVGGQTIDLESEGKAIDLALLETLQEKKTGALIRVACEMGVVLSHGDDAARTAARCFGEALGRAFQIIDDILDVTATAQELGKPIGADSENQKATFVSLMGPEQARRCAEEQTARALEALTVFGDDAQDLRHLATAMLNRTK